ncbi:MAG: membrane protein insertion efficiency factor YidD [Alphaproteobacteria bacterium]|nr:membrane protein insertion efficiency factor YidD [Alphaproteobacteria bacterium]
MGNKTFTSSHNTKSTSSRVITFLTLLIRLYQKLLSPLLGHRCRFYPSCSSYMQQALVQHGILKGLAFGMRRLFSCHPWGREGFDPVPPHTSSPVHNCKTKKVHDV